MRRPKEYFFDHGERDDKGEFISCPEGGEPLVIEEEEGRKLALCYRHSIACYIGKGWKE